jgi:hypothetical protein
MGNFAAIKQVCGHLIHCRFVSMRISVVNLVHWSEDWWVVVVFTLLAAATKCGDASATLYERYRGHRGRS